MTAIPYFIADEITGFEQEFERAKCNGHAFLVANCHNISSDPRNLDLFPPAYLLTNILLMGQLNRRILKLVNINEADPNRRHATLNYLRSVFGSSFASLENVETWLRMLSDECEISVPSLERIRQIVKFIHGSGIGEFTHEIHQASVFLAVSNTQPSDGRDYDIPTQFSVSNANPFKTLIATSGSELSLDTTEIFSPGPSVRLATEKTSRSYCIDVNFEKSDWLRFWLSYVEELVASKLYAGHR